MVGSGGGTTSTAKRVLHELCRIAVARIIEQGGDGLAQFAGTDPTEVHTDAGTGCDDLLRNHGLVVPNGRNHERQAVRKGFAYRVMASVADHCVQVRKQAELRDELADQDVIGQ